MSVELHPWRPVDERVVDEGLEQAHQRLPPAPQRLQGALARAPAFVRRSFSEDLLFQESIR